MTQEPALHLTEDEIMTCYKVLELIRDHHDETGLVHEVNTLNAAHSLVQEFENDYIQ